MFLRAEGDDTLLAKKGDTGLVVTKTTQAIIIAVAKAPQRIEDANVVVGALADYLRGVGYVSIVFMVFALLTLSQ